MAAGQGYRVGGPIPKQYLSLQGRAILTQTITAFLTHPRVDAIRVVIGRGHEALYAQAIASLPPDKLLPPVLGGLERSESVRRGLESLQELDPFFILIHDGARPFVSPDLITRVIQALAHHKGVIPATHATDTMKRATQDVIDSTVERRGLYHAQTPQGFDYSTILSAHQSLKGVPDLTDDASLLERLNIPVKIVEGDPKNQKITFPEDVKGNPMSIPDIRVGHGIDVHATGPGEGLIVLGVFIPAGFSLVGHSDADIGLHSLTDALLGALGDGDIGQHFSSTDDRWKDADSSVFLKDAVNRVRTKGGTISHVDVTLMGEHPKVAPYRSQMIAKVAEILEIDTSRVSVKATTTEKLGFIGREEGLAALATATVVF